MGVCRFLLVLFCFVLFFDDKKYSEIDKEHDNDTIPLQKYGYFIKACCNCVHYENKNINIGIHRNKIKSA